MPFFDLAELKSRVSIEDVAQTEERAFDVESLP